MFRPKQLQEGFIKSILLGMLLIAFFLTYTDSFSQKNITYDSTYTTASGIKGHAVFDYHTSVDQQLIKDGNFKFTSKKNDSVNDNVVENISWKGTYKDNEKDGEWYYEANHHEVRIGDIEGFNVSSSLYTENETLSASFKSGMPHGKWLLEKKTLVDGEEQATTANILVTFKDAKINGNFEVLFYDENNHKTTIKGKVKNGLMDGQWKLNYYEEDLPVEETRLYENGFLKQLFKTVNSKKNINLTFPLSDAILESFDNDSPKGVDVPVSLTFSDGYPRNSNYLKSQKVGEQLLSKTYNWLFKNELSVIGNYGLPMGTNRMVYEINKDERKILQEWPGVEFSYRSKINKLRTQQDINNGTDRSETLQIIYKWVDKQLELLSHIDAWNNIIGKNEIIYYNRTNDDLIDYTHNLLDKDTVKVKNNTRVFDYIKTQSQENSFLYIINHNFKERIKTVDSLTTLYQKTIDILKAQEAVGQTESKIENSLRQLYSVFKMSHDNVETRRIMRSLENNFIGDAFYKKFETVKSDTIAFENKQILSDSLWNDIQIAEKIHKKTLQLEKNHQRLDSLYTEYVFDPFTFTEQVPKRTKKKLYEIGYIDTYKDLLKKAAKANTVATMYQLINQAAFLQQRMVFLHDKETEKIERKLRKRTTTERKLELLQI